jgi:hypothetical protein
LGSPCTLTGLAKASVNAEVPLNVVTFLASATRIQLDKFEPEHRRTQEQELRDQKGTLHPFGIGSVLVARFANHALLAVICDEVSQWLAARHQFGVGVRGEAEIAHFMVRGALCASPEWSDMQGDASNAIK